MDPIGKIGAVRFGVGIGKKATSNEEKIGRIKKLHKKIDVF